VYLGKDHDTLPRDLVLFQEFAKDDLGFTVRVDVGRVKGLTRDETHKNQYFFFFYDSSF